MQIGNRWPAGTKPHPSVPAEIHDSISIAEQEFTLGKMWTLTWLEGQPICQLDGFCVVTLHGVRDLADDDVEEDDDSWLL